MKISIIGAGRVGSCLAYLLKENFEIIGLTGKKFKAEIEKEFNVFDISENKKIAKIADIIFITTSDDLIEKVSNEIFLDESIRYKYVFHCSGCHPSSILKKAKENNCFIGSIHPLQSVPDITQGIKNLKDAYFCIEGDSEAVEIAKKIVNYISGKFFIIDTKFKPLYHLGAVFSSNFINAVVFTTCEIYKKIGIGEDFNKIIEIISPLFTGSINGIKNVGIINSLTGPIVRGDTITINNHINAIKNFYPEILNTYRNLCQQTIKLARKSVKDKKILKKIEEIELLVR